MYIVPNTTIKILKNCPLDNSYKNTLYFSTSTQQLDYFASLVKYNTADCTYIRKERKIRIAITADNLYNCNYIMFQNTSFGQKWFYAFILNVEYVNDKTSEITIEIDVLQTWLFDFTVKECLVEREHSITDKIGDNIVEESVDTGPIMCNYMYKSEHFTSYVAIIATAYDPDGQAGGVQGGLFTGVKYVAGKIDTPEQVKTLLDFLTTATEANKIDSIINIFVMPTEFYPTGTEPSVQVEEIDKPITVSTHIPVNNKLLTYPFSYLTVDSMNGTKDYRFEWFTNDEKSEKCLFTENGTVSCNPNIQLVPLYYNGRDFNYTERLTMSGFPQIAYSVDAFKAWLAQDAGTTAMSGAFNTISGNPIGVAGSVTSIFKASIAPDKARGNSNGSVEVATKTKSFWFKYMCITKDYAEIIDNYFTMYGYQTNLVKVPNISSRPRWNYVKTKDCIAVGNVPADDLKTIRSVYDKGVTFWKHGNEIGNYSLDNRPV